MLTTNIHNEPQVDFEERKYYTDIRDNETFDSYMTRKAKEWHPEEYNEKTAEQILAERKQYKHKYKTEKEGENFRCLTECTAYTVKLGTKIGSSACMHCSWFISDDYTNNILTCTGKQTV